ncbi:sortase [Neobacillus drentensis]|uniref:sortase n=1 Tax=Neobacillus drentensis TaxID=220684 RepID=UPI003000DD1E
MKKGISIVLIILLVAAVSFRLVRFYEANANQAEREKLERIYEEAVEGKGNTTSSEQKKVIGKISIPSLDISYIILNQTTDKNLDISISKVVGPAIHAKGNLVLAGHNMRNGSFFGHLKGMKASDPIFLEDKAGTKKEYQMVDKYWVDKSDLSPLSQSNQTEAVLTLITCTKDPDKRLIVVAKAKIN